MYQLHAIACIHDTLQTDQKMVIDQQSTYIISSLLFLLGFHQSECSCYGNIRITATTNIAIYKILCRLTRCLLFLISFSLPAVACSYAWALHSAFETRKHYGAAKL